MTPGGKQAGSEEILPVALIKRQIHNHLFDDSTLAAMKSKDIFSESNRKTPQE